MRRYRIFLQKVKLKNMQYKLNYNKLLRIKIFPKQK